MAAITIEIDPRVLETIKRNAQQRNVSIEQQIADALRDHYGTEEKLSRRSQAEAIAALTPRDVYQTDSVTLIRLDRDR